ncbi:MAG: Ig-like domain-containing protein [Alistipes sp.]|jgi:uncharacterized protein (TIGR02145 family)|nr:Ig-like domain-containing protein [Alistipes sp.]
MKNPTLAALLIAASIVASCKEDPQGPTDIPLEKIELSDPTLALEVGDEQTLEVVFTPADATNREVEWVSNDPATVSVDQNGNIEALKPGNATVTATSKVDDTIVASCVISVTAATVSVEGIELSVPTLSLEVGAEEVLTFILTPAEPTDDGVEWSVLPVDVASVDQSGRVKALKTGEATVVVKTKDGGHTDECVVTVTRKITDLWFNKPSLILKEGASEKLVVTVIPGDASNQTLKWESDAPAIASVDQNGTVVALVPGEATVTASAQDGSGVSVSCDVTVTSAQDPFFKEVSFRTDKTWTVGAQTWSDVVMAEGCRKDTFDGGATGAYKSDCRQNGSYGDLFSWTAVSENGDVLCPDEWRVPTAEDFCTLDKTLNNSAGCELRQGAAAALYTTEWGGEYSGRCTTTGWMQNIGNMGYYWSSTPDTSYPNAAIYLYMARAAGSVNPTANSAYDFGQQLRCVK